MEPFPNMWAVRRALGSSSSRPPTFFYLTIPPHQPTRVGLVVSWSLVDAHTGCHRPDDPFADPEFQGTKSGRTMAQYISDLVGELGDLAVETVSYHPSSDAINLLMCAYAPERNLVGALITATELLKKVAEGVEIARRIRANLAVAAVDHTVTSGSSVIWLGRVVWVDG